MHLRRIMAVHAEASDSAVAATEFRATLAALGIAQNRVARLFGVGQKSIKRWRAGERGCLGGRRSRLFRRRRNGRGGWRRRQLRT